MRNGIVSILIFVDMSLYGTRVRSPKLGGTTSRQYYRYYAGYTQGFVEDMLRDLGIPQGGIIVDPWNGAGTTTVTAVTAGVNAIGYDINPAAVLIGRARLVGSDIAGSIVPIAVEVCERARLHPTELRNAGLLDTWFGPRTAQAIRAIERAIFTVLVDPTSGETQPIFDAHLRQSPLASLFYVALFRTVRDLVRKYVPSNPSWIKNPAGRRLGVPRSELQTAFVQHVKLSDPCAGQLELPFPNDASASITVASSLNLPLQDSTVDAVISSPPYCTRLDYVKATLPELAVLGLSAIDVRKLRDEMIGTPTISGTSMDQVPQEWGAETRALISDVVTHRSKASATYYRKYYMQYFGSMWTSLSELKRVLREDGSAALVVQDSFYKDIHVDLPSLIGDMALAAGWSDWTRIDFAVPVTMAAINPGARQYRKEFRATESAVVLKR